MDPGNHAEPHGRCHVNRRMLPMKIHFFLFFGSFAGVLPACILYCRKIGMSLSEMGTLYATLPFLQFVSKPLFGSIADKYRRHKLAFLASIACMGFFMFSIWFMPLPPDDIHMVDWHPHDEATFECRRPHLESSTSETMWLALCDRNDTDRHFQVLSSKTVACKVSCDTSGLPNIATVFCDKDNVDCLASDRYSFYEASKKVQLKTAHFNAVRNLTIPESNISDSNGNDSCVKMAIASVTVIPNVIHFTNGTTLAGCYLPQGTDNFSVVCSATCTAAVRPSEYSEVKPNNTVQYVWMWVALMLAWCAYGTLISMSDTIILHLLSDRPQDFGKTRLFGALGWGLMAPIIGVIIDKVSEGLAEKDYSPGFYLFGAFMLADLFVNIVFTKVDIPEKSKELFRDVVGLFRLPSVVLTACVIFVNGINTGFLWTFLVVYAQQLSGGSQLLIGLNYAVECFCSEIPFFVVSGWFMSKVGHSYAMTISLFCGGLKSFLYSLVINPWCILVIALIHGFTYGLLYASMATYVAEIAPPGTAATLQGFFQGIFEGIGVAVGNLVGGHVYQNLGGREAFFLFGVTTMAASVVHFIVARILDRLGKRKPEPRPSLPQLSLGKV